jgi:hypothetical protein
MLSGLTRQRVRQFDPQEWPGRSRHQLELAPVVTPGHNERDGLALRCRELVLFRN